MQPRAKLSRIAPSLPPVHPSLSESLNCRWGVSRGVGNSLASYPRLQGRGEGFPPSSSSICSQGTCEHWPAPHARKNGQGERESFACETASPRAGQAVRQRRQVGPRGPRGVVTQPLTFISAHFFRIVKMGPMRNWPPGHSSLSTDSVPRTASSMPLQASCRSSMGTPAAMAVLRRLIS